MAPWGTPQSPSRPDSRAVGLGFLNQRGERVKADMIAHIRAALAGRYEIDRELGAGGMATVFLARDPSGNPVALKLLHPELASTVGGDRFRREIRVAAQLQHPAILSVLDSGVETVAIPGANLELLWFTMPFIEGENAWDRLERTGPLPAAEVVRIGQTVADALTVAHAQGVVHRDIKPDNILLQGDRVLVADFGVARAVSEVQEKLTATGMVVGTPTYMSPEQASGEREIDGRTDIFALGCVLYELASGDAPFKGPTPQATLMRRFTGPPRPLRPVINVPEAVEAAILRSVARDPNDRFATAAEFKAALGGEMVPAKPAPPKAAPPVQPKAARAPTPADATAVAAKAKGCMGVILLAAALVSSLMLAGLASG
jgi:serine/threonine protein kinase